MIWPALVRIYIFRIWSCFFLFCCPNLLKSFDKIGQGFKFLRLKNLLQFLEPRRLKALQTNWLPHIWLLLCLFTLCFICFWLCLRSSRLLVLNMDMFVFIMRLFIIFQFIFRLINLIFKPQGIFSALSYRLEIIL